MSGVVFMRDSAVLPVVQFAQVKHATVLVPPSFPGGGASYSISTS